MCGIVGFINCGSEDELNEATQRVIHRGPDGQHTQWFEQRNSGLGHTRLSIIDLSEDGAQPMHHAQSGHWITFNGEVYNYSALRKELMSLGHQFTSKSDTEVILVAYLEWQEACLEKFNGMFAFCIYHPMSGKVFLARDRQGIKPLYYWYQRGKFAFASEIKSLLCLKDYEPKPDIQAIHTPVHFQVAPQTGFKDILKLKAGHYLTFSDNEKLNINNYWKLAPSEDAMRETEAVDQLESLLIDSTRLNMVADVPVGIMLSGGLDSSLVAALMKSQSPGEINSFTIKFEADDLKLQGNVDDSYYANRVATELGFNHHEILIKPDIVDLVPKMVYHLDEPIADPAAINTYLIAKAAKEKGIKVLLTGMGADEVFAGYRAQLACLKAQPYRKFIPSFIRYPFEKAIRHLPESNSKRNFKYIRWVKRFLEVASLDPFYRHLAVKNSALTTENYNQYYLKASGFLESVYVKTQQEIFRSASHLSYLNQICLSDTLTYMTDHNLTYNDKATMAAGVEGRPTLLDHRLIAFMFSISPEFKIKKNTQKYLLKKVAENYLPSEIIYRPKAPFSAPMRGWLKNQLRPMVADTLSHDALKKRDIYNPDFVDQIIRENDSGLRDWSQLIWRLMINQIWFDTFFKH